MNLIMYTKCGVVTFGESNTLHFQSTNEWKRKLSEVTVDEVYEYKNLGVLETYVSSLNTNVKDNIERATKRGNSSIPYPTSGFKNKPLRLSSWNLIEVIKKSKEQPKKLLTLIIFFQCKH